MAFSALIFGGIGSLVETSALQLEAFNRAFAVLGINFRWNAADYAASLSNTGGRKRLGAIGLADGSRLGDAAIAQVHAEKTRQFDALLIDRGLPLRAGVAGLIAHAQRHRVALAWATTTSQANIDAIFRATADALPRDTFATVGNDRAVDRQKPDPAIYTTILATLGIGPDAAFAIEDSPTGVSAAKAARLFTVAFPGAMHDTSDFAAADLLAASLDEVQRLIA